MPQPRIRRPARVRIVLLVLLVPLALPGCRSVAFYEKAAFANPVMQAEPDAGETHLRQKVHYSREGAIGGIGKTAGGGCGCY